MGLLKRSRKKTVKPTAGEQKKISARLKRKYPQMYTAYGSKAERAAYESLSPGDKREISKLIGLKLKKKYGG